MEISRNIKHRNKTSNPFVIPVTLLLLIIILSVFWQFQLKDNPTQAVLNRLKITNIIQAQPTLLEKNDALKKMLLKKINEEIAQNLITSGASTSINNPVILMPSNAQSAEANSTAIAKPAIINSMPSQESIIEGIKKQHDMRLLVAQAVSNRVKQMNDVHQQILASGALNASNQRKTLVPPKLNAPPEVLNKVKSHEWTAH